MQLPAKILSAWQCEKILKVLKSGDEEAFRVCTPIKRAERNHLMEK